MPKNKEALIRFRIINNCLLKGKVCSKEYMIAKIEETLGTVISLRTFAEDIKNMREDESLGFLAPIVYDKNEKGYYYSDPSYSIDNIPLNADEIEALTFAASLFNQYRRIEIFEKFTGAVDKIVDLVSLRRKMDSTQVEQFVEFENAPLIHGSEYIEPLATAIRTKKVLAIEYQSFTSESIKTYEVHPFYLKEYRNRWYLIAFENEKQNILTFGLERIKNIKELPHLLFTNFVFNPKSYFSNIIGISVSNIQSLPVRVVLSFSAPLHLYVLTQPLHASQKLVNQTETGCVMEFQLCPNFELKSLILSYGKNCKVIEPVELQKEIMEMTKEIEQLYQ